VSLLKQVRTTISLPEASLVAAKAVAKSRNVSLGTVVAEALDAEMKRRQERTEAILERYRLAFDGFSEEELMLLDGIHLQRKRTIPRA
jgi:hypothetical protein